MHPLRQKCDLGLKLRAGVVEAGGAHGHQDPHLHVVVAQSPARESHLPEEIAALEHLDLHLGHLLERTFKVLDPAGGALGVGAAAVQDIYPRIFLNSQEQPLPLLHVERPDTLNLQLRHELSSPWAGPRGSEVEPSDVHDSSSPRGPYFRQLRPH